jgi:outer membrane protein/protease secretion system outer membrane protein
VRARPSWIALALLASAAAWAQQGPVLDLAQAFRLAESHDATLRAARARAESRAERLPQARSQLLPSVSLSAGRFHNELHTNFTGAAGAPGTIDMDYPSSTRVLSLRQGLLRMTATADVRQAEAEVAQAQALLESEEQNLAVRLVDAYVQVLAGNDQVEAIEAQKLGSLARLDAADKRMRGGAGTRADIDEAQARHDLLAARELEARQNVALARQRLASLIGTVPGTLAAIDPARFAPQAPAPARVEEWIARAEQASPEMRAALSRLQAAREAVAKAEAGHLPTLDAVAQVSHNRADDVNRIDRRYRQTSVGVQLLVPIYGGGFVSSRVRQALSDAGEADALLQAARADLALRVHKEFRGVSEGVLRVRALEQALRSSETLLQTTLRSYDAGMRTQLDVLQAQEQRAAAVLGLSDARQAYLLASVRLAALAGEAGPPLLARISNWLDVPRK